VLERGGALLLAAFGVVALGLIIGIPPGVAPLDRVTGLEVALLYQLPTYALIGAVILDRIAGVRSLSALDGAAR